MSIIIGTGVDNALFLFITVCIDRHCWPSSSCTVPFIQSGLSVNSPPLKSPNRYLQYLTGLEVPSAGFFCFKDKLNCSLAI